MSLDFFGEYKIVIIWLSIILLMMIVDMVTGFAQAYVNKTIKSHKMSDGLIKKGCVMLVLISVFPLTLVMPDVITLPILITVYGFEMVNEFTSIFENLQKMGVDTKWLSIIYNRLDEKNNKKM